VSALFIRLRCLQRAGSGEAARMETLAEGVHERHPSYLEPGETTLEHRFKLPDHTPPSYQGRHVWVRYELEVHVVIPWWRDRRVTWLLPVHPRPTPPKEEAPRIFVIHRADDDPRVLIEATLGATTVPRGGALQGRLSLSNLGDLSPRQLTVSLVARETHGWIANDLARLFPVENPPLPREGESVSFQLSVPIDAPYSYQSSWSLEWAVQIRLELNWRKDAVLHIPVQVVAAEPSAAAPAVALVGRERRTRLLSSAAREESLEYDAGLERIRRRFRCLDVEIGLESDASRGQKLAATLRWPPLGLELQTHPRSRLRPERPGDIVLRLGAQSFVVRGHQPSQVQALFDAPIWRLYFADHVFESLQFDDAGARLTSPTAGDTAKDLLPFISNVVALANVLDDAISRLPPRSVMKPHAAAWRRHAETLRGRFEPGRIRIHDGVAGQDRVEIATLWSRDGEVAGTRIRLLLAPPLTEPPPTHSPLAVQLQSDCEKVILDAAAIELHLQLAALDPAGLMPLVERAQRLVTALRGTGGPYR
jgi:hypothetical protein